MSTLKHRPGLFPAGRLAALAVLAMSIAVAALSTAAHAQQPPAPRVEIAASMELQDSPRQYDLVQMLVEFAPGASNLAHRVNGRAIFTVLSGKLTRVEEDGETVVFGTGETFREADSDHFDVEINNGTVPAQLLATFLLQPGAPPLIIHPDATPPSIGPRVLAMARTTVGTIPAQFTLAHGIIVADPGAVVPPHTHDGWQMVTTLSGEPQPVLGGVVQTGATFIDRPGVVHEGGNPGPAPARFMFAALNPQGAPQARPVGGTQPAIQPPATGDAGLAAAR
jgi:quercetin dioxygenase-like cupin family protein